MPYESGQTDRFINGYVSNETNQWWEYVSALSRDERLEFHQIIPAFYLIRPIYVVDQTVKNIESFNFINEIANVSQIESENLKGTVAIDDFQITLTGDLMSVYEISFTLNVFDYELLNSNKTIKVMSNMGTNLQIAFGRYNKNKGIDVDHIIETMNDFNNKKIPDIATTFDGNGQVVFATISKVDITYSDMGVIELKINAVGLGNKFAESVPIDNNIKKVILKNNENNLETKKQFRIHSWLFDTEVPEFELSENEENKKEKTTFFKKLINSTFNYSTYGIPISNIKIQKNNNEEADIIRMNKQPAISLKEILDIVENSYINFLKLYPDFMGNSNTNEKIIKFDCSEKISKSINSIISPSFSKEVGIWTEAENEDNVSLGDILIISNAVNNLIESSNTLMDFVRSLINFINNKIRGKIKLKIIQNPSNGNTFAIVNEYQQQIVEDEEKNTTQSKRKTYDEIIANGEVLNLNIFTAKSLIQNLTINSDFASDVGMEAFFAIGNNVYGLNDESLNIINNFLNRQTSEYLDSLPENEQAKRKEDLNQKENFVKELLNTPDTATAKIFKYYENFYKNKYLKDYKITKNINEKIDEELKKLSEKIFEFKLQLAKAKSESDPFLKYVPYKINATIFGLSDIWWGTLLKIDETCPIDWLRKTLWKVIGVQHNLNDSGWTTTIDAILTHSDFLSNQQSVNINKDLLK